ncbi:hypothetical protein, unknown function [Leishmania braziliensis MHOM/BR/75/M2904]|uniref:Uncharacterized protein n=1 Tax=Leishmania braziliensis TaxID=5660 RepID=A4HAX0_LEIBR|nr:hypothetical protein, unknown function [Leishmania braziliensis MHOM/BR/75/M2904]CAM38555.2 hypothetical protein, unknown function [Leishmania braziliensis MHOM/BR/75/M2904]
MDYHYPNVWALYAKRWTPKDGLDAAKDMITELQVALAAKEEEAAKNAAELEEQRAEAEKLAAELVEQRAEAEKLAAELVEQRAEAEKLAAELVEQRAEAEKLAAELVEQRAEAEKLAAELEEKRAEAEKLAAELEEQRAEAEKLAAELEEQRAEAEKLAAELEEQRAEAEKLAAELVEQRAEAEKLAAEVAAFRAKRNAALEARDADGTLPVLEKAVAADEAAAQALDPRQIADGPLYAVTLEEYRDRDAAVGQLAAELEEQRAEAEKLAAELVEQRAEAEKLAAELEEKRAEAEKLAAEVVEKRAEAEKLAAELEEQRAEAEKLAAELVEQRAEAEKLAAEVVEQRAEAEKLAAEVAAFRAKRNAALEARDADGTLPVLEKAVAADEAAAQALDPRQIADGPLYAVTLEELLQAREEAARNVEAMDDNAAALESELLDVLMQLKVMKGENAALEDLCKEKDAAVADLEKHDVRANNSDKAKPQTTSRHSKVFEGEEWGTVMATKPHALHEAFVSDVCAACRVGRDDLSEVTFALGSLMAGVSVTHNSDISCDDIAKLVMDYHYPNVWALYAKRWTPKDGLDAAKDMITELQVALAAKEEEAAKNAAELEEQRAEAEKLAAEVVEQRAEAEKLAAEVEEQRAEAEKLAAELEEQRAEAEKLAAELVEQRAEAEKLAAEVAAFRAKRNAALEARDADGTLPVLEKAVAADEAAAQALDPRQIADGPLYAVTLEEYRDRDAAVGQLAAELEEQRAEAEKLAAELVEQRAEAEKLAAELEEQRAEAEKLAAELVEQRAEAEKLAAELEEKRAEAEKLAAELVEQRAEAEKLAAELEEQRAEAEKLAAELVEQRAEAEKLAAELVEQRAEAEKLAAEVAAFRAKRDAALEALDADGTLPVLEKAVAADEAAAQALDPRQIADGPLYAVTLEEYRDRDAAVGQLAAELEEQRAEAEKLAAELVEQRAEAEKLAAELEEKRAEAEKLAAELVEQRAEAEKLAAELEEQRAEAEKLAAELVEQRAEAEKLAAEVAAFRAKRNVALEARDADGTLPVLEKAVAADEAAAQALDPRHIADGPLYAVTLEEYRDRDAAVGQLAAELEEQRAEAEKLAAELEEQRAEAGKLAAEVAAFRAKRNAALEARDADGTLPVLEKAVAADEAAAQALDPRQIADGPLYAVTLEELLQAREEAARNVEAMDDNAAALESELLDVLMQLKVMKGENAALEDLCKEKDAAVADLEKHDVRAKKGDKASRVKVRCTTHRGCSAPPYCRKA